MPQKNYIIVAVLVLLVGAGGFIGGVKYQQFKTRSNVGNFVRGNMEFRGQVNGRGGQNGQGMMRAAGNGQGFRPVTGEVISQDEKSITVKLPDGSSKIVMFGEQTTIGKSTTGTKDDLKVGENVMVVGSENSDGSVTAQNIQLNPPVRQINSAQPTATPQPQNGQN